MRRPMVAIVEDPPPPVLLSCELAIAAGACDGLDVIAADLSDTFRPRGVPTASLLPLTAGTITVMDNEAHVVGREPFTGYGERPTNNCVRVVGGECYSVTKGPVVLDRPASSQRWVISGTTRDSAGTAIGGCRVVLIDASRMAPGLDSTVVDTLTSAAVPTGGFTFEVSGGGDYWIIAYLPGSPDRAGASLHPVTPVAA